jgi:hypothetical protein
MYLQPYVHVLPQKQKAPKSVLLPATFVGGITLVWIIWPAIIARIQERSLSHVQAVQSLLPERKQIASMSSNWPMYPHSTCAVIC